MTTLGASNLQDLAAAWRDVDPDADTRAELDAVFAGDPEQLAETFTERLAFGTAGLRGTIGAGPGRMNRVLVRVVAAALGARVLVDEDAPTVVVGFDARHKSRDFAEDTARVLAAKGVATTLFADPVPTPVLAFAVRRLEAAAGVMVTASHNPRTDNGYKVYWRGGAQIIPPIDSEISQLIENQHLLGDGDLAPLDHDLIRCADRALVDEYLVAAGLALTPSGARQVSAVYTPLHGVGTETLMEAFVASGFEPPVIVESQAAPDPDFPTTAFPNPEEAGVLDPLLALADEVDADIALANDPDADRLAVVVKVGQSTTLLTGDEVGCLLAEHRLGRHENPQGSMVANTVVSSRLLREIAAHHGATYVETLTGFKWIMAAREDRAELDFVLGYEEALGYAVTDAVRDKDGISAALVVAEMAAELRSEGRTLLDLRNDMHQRYGVHVTGQRSIKFEDSAAGAMDAAMAALRSQPPEVLAGRTVTATIDLAAGGGDLPPTNGVVLELDGGRVVVRPSGTEPKMKVYGEIVRPAGADLGAAQLAARSDLTMLLDDAVATVAAPERPALEPAGAAPPELDARALFQDLPEGGRRAADLRTLVRCVDLTTLEGDDTPGRVRALCAQALRPDPADPTVGPTAAVCVYPLLVPVVVELTAGTSVRTASVAGAFPSGLSPLAVRLADIAEAVAAGADEIDLVLNRSAFLAGRGEQVADELRQSIAAARPAHTKVILEVGELGDPASIGTAALLAMEAGADTIKTSTGKAKTSATPEAVLAMAEAIRAHHRVSGRRVGLKVAGGVRTATDALGYAAIVRAVLGEEWFTPELFRLGASSLLGDLLADLRATEAALRAQ